MVTHLDYTAEEINDVLKENKKFESQLKAQQVINAKSLGIKIEMPIEEQAELNSQAIGDLNIIELEEGTAWTVGNKVTVNQTVTYNSKSYRCVQPHITQADWTPDITPALWTVATSGIAEFKQPTGASDAYKKGDKVLFNGKTYESLIDANTWSPTAYPAGWKLI